MNSTISRLLKVAVLGSASAVVLSGCSFNPYGLPLPGGASLGSNPYTVTVHFRDILDLVPQSGVRVNDVSVGKVTNIKLDGWTAVIQLKINRDAKLPDNAEATIRQTSLLGEKFVSLSAPAEGAEGTLSDGDVIPLDRAGRNPELEEVFGAASLLFNGGGLEKTNTIVKELNKTLDGNEPEIRDLLASSNTFITQLDNNKQALVTSLEKVDKLAIATNKQKGAITGALDNLPAALKVVNQQRDDLVKLLKALNHLGDVGTSVVHDSKADTVADFKALGPILRKLADSGDNLAKSLGVLLTYPFPDGFGGAPTVQSARDFHNGDFVNLSVTLDATAASLAQFIPGLADISSGLPLKQSGSTNPLTGLTDLLPGLVPLTSKLPVVSGLLPGAKTSSPTKKTTPAPAAGSETPKLCSLLGSCRVAPSNLSEATSTDLGRLLIEPVVAS
ncbi:MAG: MCE family protein [Aeromicrobium sp.]